jgi:DNA polymerase-3 subunit alpha
MDHTDKVVVMIDECRHMNLLVNPPHINHSEYKFTVDGSDTVIYGLGAIKGVGEAAIESIIAEREQSGQYRDLFEFCRRVDLRKANRRVLESLIRSGAMDELGANRATLMSQLPLALKMAEQHHAMQEAGQNDMFGMSDESVQSVPDQIVPDAHEEWDEQLRLQAEKETLGLYLTGHPINRYLNEFPGVGISRISDLALDNDSGVGGKGYAKRGGVKVMIAGLVISSSHRMTQRGRMGTVILDDSTARIEVTLFSEAYEEHRELLAADKILVVTGSLNYDEYRGGLSIRADQVLEFEQARSLYAMAIQLDTAKLNGSVNPELLSKIHGILKTYQGGNCNIRLRMVRPDSHGILEFGEEWKVTPTDELLRRLERLFDQDAVKMIYGNRP